MCFATHPICISGVKSEQPGGHDWFACEGQNNEAVSQLKLHFEHKSSRWFSFNLLMFVCFFFPLSFFLIPRCIKRQTDLRDYVQHESVSLRDGGWTGSQIPWGVCCGYKCWRSLALKRIRFTSDLRRPGRLAAAAAQQSVVRWYWGICPILTAANGIKRSLIKVLI